MGLFDLFSGPDINAKVAEAKSDADAVIIDVRSRDEYQAGHIEGAVCVPLDEISKGARVYRGKHIYAYCASGARSRMAVSQLRSLGVEQAENIGGIGAWRGAIVRG